MHVINQRGQNASLRLVPRRRTLTLLVVKCVSNAI